MTDRRRYDPYAPPPVPSDVAEVPVEAPATSLTGVVQPPPVVEPVSLPDDLDDITKPDLISLAERHGVATYGTKAAIAARLREL